MLMIDNLHQYLREVITLAEAIRVAKKQNRACEESVKKSADEAKSIKEEISKLKTEIIKIESECKSMEKEVQLKNADSDALKQQLEGFFEMYDNLLADNKDLKDQLHDVEERSSHSSGKKMGFFSWDQWGL